MVQLGDETAGQPPKDLVGFLNFYLVTKAPIQIPEAGREAIVRWGPWVLVVLLVITLPAALFILGLGALVAPFAGVNYATGFGLSAIGLLVTFALEVAALPGLFARKMSGWNLLFYARLVSIVASLLSFYLAGAVIGGLLSLYLLFQVRSLYKA
jgi:hypothetical protein